MYRLLSVDKRMNAEVRTSLWIVLRALSRDSTITLEEVYTDEVNLLQVVKINNQDIIPMFDKILPDTHVPVEVYHTASTLRNDCLKYKLVDASKVQSFVSRINILMQHNNIADDIMAGQLKSYLSEDCASLDDDTLTNRIRAAVQSCQKEKGLQARIEALLHEYQVDISASSIRRMLPGCADTMDDDTLAHAVREAVDLWSL